MTSARLANGIARATLAGVLSLGATACDRDWPAADPPKLSQIECTRSGVPRVVYVLDTGRSAVTWADGPQALEGKLVVSEYEYVLDFPSRPGAPAYHARINRFDGQMVREIGRLPFGKQTPANLRETLTCASAKLGPRF